MNAPKKVYSVAELMIRLGIITAISAALVAVVSILTEPARQQAQQAVTDNAIKEVLPADVTRADTFLTYEGVEFYPAFRNGGLYGFAVKSDDLNGYGGKITVMFGLDKDGILGIVQVIEQNETPGLGTQETVRSRQKTIVSVFQKEEAASGLAPNEYLDQYNGRVVTPETKQWDVSTAKCDTTCVTAAKAGATVSMRAVNGAVYKGAAVFAKNKAAICTDALKAGKETK